jgi:hypothetical protein
MKKHQAVASASLARNNVALMFERLATSAETAHG